MFVNESLVYQIKENLIAVSKNLKKSKRDFLWEAANRGGELIRLGGTLSHDRLIRVG